MYTKIFRAIISSDLIERFDIMKAFVEKYKHGWPILYVFIYFPWFIWLEKNVTENFHLIHVPLDDKIPFIEYFIIPYLSWFAFIAVFVLYFFFTDKKEFYQLAALLASGMTLFLIISTLFPNGLMLRPTSFARDNVFVDMCKMLWRADTSTNVFPSIHVYNSVAVTIAVLKSRHLKEHRWVQIGCVLLAILIILSTMFLKQHSVVDVIGGILMAAAIYPFVYATRTEQAVRQVKRQPVRQA